MTTYWEQLRDPRWQKKRLEIMQRDEFICQSCGDAGKTLNVHHGYYAKGLAPWEYEDETLRTLCEDCHKMAEESLASLRQLIGKLDPATVDIVRGFASFFAEPAINDSPWLRLGIAYAARVDEEDVHKATEAARGTVDLAALGREARRRSLVLSGIRQVLEQMDKPVEDPALAAQLLRNGPRTLEIFARRLVGAPDPAWMAEYLSDVESHREQRGEGDVE
jgi:hypothetical protein